MIVSLKMYGKNGLDESLLTSTLHSKIHVSITALQSILLFRPLINHIQACFVVLSINQEQFAVPFAIGIVSTDNFTFYKRK